MGYDNNTPLSGVTGGGLPAEVWHETMSRVLDGMIPLPLPMTAPSGEPAGQVMSDEQAQSLIDLILRDLQNAGNQ